MRSKVDSPLCAPTNCEPLSDSTEFGSPYSRKTAIKLVFTSVADSFGSIRMLYREWSSRMVSGKQRTPLPNKKSPLKSVCHISLQWCFSNRWYGVCFADSAGSISPLRLMMLQQVLSLGSPSTPAASKAARIVFPPQAGWDKRVCTISASTSSAVLEGCWCGLLLWSQSGRPSVALLSHLYPVLRLIP